MHKTSTYWCIIAIRVLNALFYTALFFLAILPCIPREKFWNPFIEGTCIDNLATFLASSVFNLCSDLAMLALPLYTTLRLQMDAQRKAGVCAIFAVGIM